MPPITQCRNKLNQIAVATSGCFQRPGSKKAFFDPKIIVTDLKSDAELEEAQTRLETAKAKRELKVLRIEAENKNWNLTEN